MLGIDIGRGAVKLVVMRRRRRGWCLQACVVQPVPGGAGDSVRLDMESAVLRDTLNSALAQLPMRVRDAAVAIASADAVTRIVRLPAGLKDHEIENRIAVEAEKHLPFAMADACLDFCQLQGEGAARSQEQEVMLVACRRGSLMQRVNLLKACGIRVVVADVDAMALCRLAAPPPNNATQVVLDLGISGYRLHAYAEGRLLYSRNHPVGDSAATGLAARPARDADPALQSWLVHEIRRAIQLFLISSAGQEQINITVTGGLASLPGLVPSITKACGRPASLMQPPADISLHARIEASPWRTAAPQLLQACALAMRADG